MTPNEPNTSKLVKVAASITKRHKDYLEVSLPKTVGTKTIRLYHKDGIDYLEQATKIIIPVTLFKRHSSTAHIKLYNKHGILVINQNVLLGDILK